jgi:anaphase-promoting complex subunit 4
VSTLCFPRDSTILDAKFADDANLLVLLQTGDKEKVNSILNIPYTTSSKNALLAYTPVQVTSVAAALLPEGAKLSDELRTKASVTDEMIQRYTRHVFEGRFTPLKLVVNGRKGRRVIVVLGSDKKHYRVLDMDFRKGGARIQDEDAEESDDEVGVAEDDEDVEMSGA